MCSHDEWEALVSEVFGSEVERRRLAVKLVEEDGVTVGVAAGRVGRSGRWLHTWLRRFEAEGDDGLRDRSRAPRSRPTATRPEVVAKILAVRDELEGHPFANRGAEAIRYELVREGFEPLVSRATIERVLQRAGRTRTLKRSAPRADRRPLPQVRGLPGIWQQIDWVGPRYLARRVRFSSLHVVDVGGGGAAAAQYPDEQLHRTVGFLTERAWPSLSIPLHLQTDGAFVAQLPGRQPRPFNVFVRTCLFFGVEVVISPPEELGWQNWVESFNGLWQARTIRRHTYRSVNEVSADSDRFITYYLTERPHPQLRAATHHTRLPAELIDRHRSQLRFPPPGFTLDDHQDRHGRLRIPLAQGRLSYLCRVATGGIIRIARRPYHVPPALTGLVVCATVLTASRRLDIRHHGEIVATHRFPIPDTTITPYHPPAHRGLFYSIGP